MTNFPGPVAETDAQPFDYSLWAEVLNRFVDDRGAVDYDSLSRDRKSLDGFLTLLTAHSPNTSPELFADRPEQLAFYLNAYNALVFDGVLKRGPEKTSVWKGGLISGYNFFAKQKFVLGGEKISLKKLEDDWIREAFEDPRIHAALNCASISCPRLPREPFLASTLEEQLDAAMTEFVSRPENVLVDGSTVYLSKIFDWFKEDFALEMKKRGQSDASLVDYVNLYRKSGEKLGKDLQIKFFPYNKGVNSQESLPW